MGNVLTNLWCLLRASRPEQTHYMALGMNYSVAGFEMVLTRKISFYVVTYYLPSGLFVVVSWISFLVRTHVQHAAFPSVLCALRKANFMNARCSIKGAVFEGNLFDRRLQRKPWLCFTSERLSRTMLQRSELSPPSANPRIAQGVRSGLAVAVL